MVIRNYHVGESFCAGLSNFSSVQQGGDYDGNFYTDPKGNQAFEGPGEHRIHQFVAPGFELKIVGKHVLKMVDHYETLYGYPGKLGIDSDALIWDSIDASVN